MYPSSTEHDALLSHCSHARFVWNLAVDQASNYRVTRCAAPGHLERNRQLTEARAASDWLRDGSQTVQQQALRDFDVAQRAFFQCHAQGVRPPTFRKRYINEGFRIVAVRPEHVRKINRRWSEVRIPKIGWIRFRRTRATPDARSFRITLDRAGRWHIAFAAIPPPIPAPGTGEVAGVDRGIVHTAALHDGTFYDYARPDLDARVRRLQRQLSRARKGSNRRARVRTRLGRAQARRADARKDFIEKTTTDIATHFDLVRLENLKTKNMTRSAKGTADAPGVNVRQKAGLNRAILDKGWGLFATRLEQKAKGRVEYVPATYTSQRCSACQVIAGGSRKNQATFLCVACGFSANADTNAAINIAAGHAVTARGGGSLERPVDREPQVTHLPRVA